MSTRLKFEGWQRLQVDADIDVEVAMKQGERLIRRQSEGQRVRFCSLNGVQNKVSLLAVGTIGPDTSGDYKQIEISV